MDELTQLAHQAGIGTIAVYLVQWLKNSKWCPWISAETDRLNRWLSIGIAVATSIGIKYVSSGSFSTGLHLVIDIPAARVLLDTAVHVAAQFSGQQVLYHTAVKTVDVPPAAKVMAAPPVTIHGATLGGPAPPPAA